MSGFDVSWGFISAVGAFVCALLEWDFGFLAAGGAQLCGRLPLGKRHHLTCMACEPVLDTAKDTVLGFASITTLPSLNLFILHKDNLIAQQFGCYLVRGVIETILLFRIRPTDSHTITPMVVRPLFLTIQFSLFSFEAVGFSNHDIVFRSVGTCYGGFHAHVQSDDGVLNRR